MAAACLPAPPPLSDRVAAYCGAAAPPLLPPPKPGVRRLRWRPLVSPLLRLHMHGALHSDMYEKRARQCQGAGQGRGVGCVR